MKVYIFGMGSLYQKFKKQLKHVNIAGFLTNDTKMWNKLFEGKRIFSPEILKEEKHSTVIIASSYIDEISNQLKKYGYQENVNYFLLNKIVSVTEFSENVIRECLINNLGTNYSSNLILSDNNSHETTQINILDLFSLESYVNLSEIISRYNPNYILINNKEVYLEIPNEYDVYSIDELKFGKQIIYFQKLNRLNLGYHILVKKRLKYKMFELMPSMESIFKGFFNEYNINPKGIIHIGAHEGQELKLYNNLGFEKVFLIEANPIVFKQLIDNTFSQKNVYAINYAISNKEEELDFYIMSGDQSSSLLRPKDHLEIYPEIQINQMIKVKTKTLDYLHDTNKNIRTCNVLCIDVQGAELLVLQGAVKVLEQIELIQLEVNFRELYEKCALVNEIDIFLEKYNFRRTYTYSLDDPSWGEAFYVKDRNVIHGN